MGPSRVNPHTGQILDADIIFDADFLQYWKREYETFTPKGIALMTGGPVTLEDYRAEVQTNPYASQHRHGPLCTCNLLSWKGPRTGAQPRRDGRSELKTKRRP